MIALGRRRLPRQPAQFIPKARPASSQREYSASSDSPEPARPANSIIILAAAAATFRDKPQATAIHLALGLAASDVGSDSEHDSASRHFHSFMNKVANCLDSRAANLSLAACQSPSDLTGTVSHRARDKQQILSSRRVRTNTTISRSATGTRRPCTAAPIALGLSGSLATPRRLAPASCPAPEVGGVSGRWTRPQTGPSQVRRLRPCSALARAVPEPRFRSELGPLELMS